MNSLSVLIKRNTKLFFRDKGMFLTSLITPGILLLLYSTFLGNVYKNSFISSMPEGITLSDEILNGVVGGQLLSSILAVSCVTVAVSCNMLMVQDRANGSLNDLMMTPVKRSTLALGYYFATLISTLIICFAAVALGLAYIAFSGWYMSLGDVLWLCLDVLLLVMFGTALSSVINFFLSTQGQIAAVGTIVSSCYGFICGAYMPISQFSPGLQKAVSLLPGTYGTALVRTHSLRGVFGEMERIGVPEKVLDEMETAVDSNLYFFGSKVSVGAMFAVLSVTVVMLVGAYVLLNIICKKKNK
ncbi:MAG: ABC transporter permease [Ruminococcaceae bacterium]|nr:ABC transporter permease [Oscillospiraceae bacterium]